MTQLTVEDIRDPVLFQVGFLNIIPHPKQIQVLRSKAKFKIICTGRRAGKSKMIAGEIIRGAWTKEYQKQIVIAPLYKQSKIVYNEILTCLTSAKLLHNVKSFSLSPYPVIIFKNGYSVDFASADNPNSLRGEKYNRLFIDESSFIKPDGWRAIRPLSFDTGAPIWQTSTPWGKDDFHKEYLKGLRGEGDYESFHFSTFDNPHIDADAVRAEVEEYGESSIYVQTEIFGNFIEDVDLLFPSALVKECIDESYEMVELLI